MRTPGLGFTLALVLLASTTANALLPAAPQVTMGADIKLLRLDWEPVDGALYYMLRHRPDASSAYLTLGELIPPSTTQVEVPIPVHQQNWPGARYTVSACNTEGCTHSAPLNPRWLMLDTIGYLKASNSEREDAFGQGIALSADGFTLAVSAWFESSNATLVNGDQTNNLSPQSGAVYVLRRRGNTWQQEAYLKAGTNQSQQYFGTDYLLDRDAMALSADGSMLAVAASRQHVDGVQHAGAVHIFRRIQNVWGLMITLHAPQLLENDLFGTSVDMSHDGRTLKVNSFRPGLGIPTLRTHLFVRPANTWQFSTTLAPFDTREICQNSRLSGNGRTLVFTCTQPPHFDRIVTVKRIGDAWVQVAGLGANSYLPRQSIALNADASVMALSERIETPAAVGFFRWNGLNWTREASISTPLLGMTVHNFGWELALDDTGQSLAISDPDALEAGPGISSTVIPGTATMGAVYLYQRNDDTGTWSLRNVVKSPRPGFRDRFGLSIAMSSSGRTLAVGAPGENSNATGIDGDRNNENAPNAGAAYLY